MEEERQSAARPRRYFITLDTYEAYWCGHLSIGLHWYLWSSCDYGDAGLLDTKAYETLAEAIAALKAKMATLFRNFSAICPPLLLVSTHSGHAARYTERQGQYLAFIHAYKKVNGRPPAQADVQRFFAVTAPSVHQMLLNLERRGLLRRTPRQPRSLEVLVAPEDLPALR